jgi:hypothetical protein
MLLFMVSQEETISGALLNNILPLSVGMMA